MAKQRFRFICRCELEKYGSVRIGFTRKDVDRMYQLLGENGWGNARIHFHKDTNRPFMVEIDPNERRNRPQPPVGPLKDDPEPVPEELDPPEDLDKEPDRSMPF